jgi:hypothetical protein
VNLVDITIVAKGFGSKSVDPNWNPTVDLDENGKISTIDITIVGKDLKIHSHVNAHFSAFHPRPRAGNVSPTAIESRMHASA